MDFVDGLKVSRWPLVLAVLAVVAVIAFNANERLSLAIDLVLIAPGLLALSFFESKLLWDTYGKRVGFTLPADRWASLALFLGVLAANAWIVG